MRPVSIITSVIILLTSALSCSNCERNENVPIYYMSDEFKSYVVFPKGSYWVYEEVSSQALDSVYLYRSTIEIKNESDKLGYNYQEFLGIYKSSYLSDSISGFAYPEFDDQKFYEYTEGSLSDFLNRPIIFFGDNSVGYKHKYTDDFTVEYEAFLESMEIQGEVYGNVKVFKHNIQYFSYQSERIYFAKDIGIIKRELFNGQVWELKRHFINN